jgi:DNA-binding CsgD family transcriptional regulator
MNSSRYFSLQTRLDVINECMCESPGYYYITDISHRALYVNNNLLADAGKPLSNVLGKTVFCEESEKYEFLYRRNDRWVLGKKRGIQVYEVVENYKKETFIVATQKEPFLHMGEVVGVCGISVKLPVVDMMPQVGCSQPLFFVDIQRKQDLQLSLRQREVLYFTLQGLCAKSVANRLQVSSRTVEHHLEAVKEVNGYASIKEILLQVRAV